MRHIDHIAGKRGNRSRVIEKAVAEYVARRTRAERDRRDRALLDGHADELNEEMHDVLGYQVDL